jgi:hypothetical protein
MASAALIDELADNVEALTDTGRVFSLRLEPGDTAEQRATLIDAYSEVVQELRRRGHHDIRGTVGAHRGGRGRSGWDAASAGPVPW